MARMWNLLSSALVGILLAAVAPAAAHAESSIATPTLTAFPTCGTAVHMIVARGSGEEPGLGRMGMVAGNVTERLPGSTVDAVTYPATFSDYIESEGDGAVAMAEMIAAHVKQCPDARIALLGYSQGGHATMDVVCGTSEDAFKVTPDLSAVFEENIIAVVTFGDPSHVPDVEWDRGTSKNEGIFPRQNTSACEPYSGIIRGWCDEGDIYCDSGDNRKVHGTYFANYTDDAVDFIVGNFNRSKEEGGSGGGSAGGSDSSATGTGTTGTATATGATKPTSTGTTTGSAGSPNPTGNGAGSRQPSGAVMAGLAGMVMACVALF